mmetsp:Transcript_8187/g.32258  ORF Transcript_8187/g.32258 Transcript_8187/m.32258 type:complete len:335 (-) Transcript_8187:503-1507(-)
MQRTPAPGTRLLLPACWWRWAYTAATRATFAWQGAVSPKPSTPTGSVSVRDLCRGEGPERVTPAAASTRRLEPRRLRLRLLRVRRQRPELELMQGGVRLAAGPLSQEHRLSCQEQRLLLRTSLPLSPALWPASLPRPRACSPSRGACTASCASFSLALCARWGSQLWPRLWQQPQRLPCPKTGRKTRPTAPSGRPGNHQLRGFPPRCLPIEPAPKDPPWRRFRQAPVRQVLACSAPDVTPRTRLPGGSARPPVVWPCGSRRAWPPQETLHSLGRRSGTRPRALRQQTAPVRHGPGGCPPEQLALFLTLRRMRECRRKHPTSRPAATRALQGPRL